jgi:Subtilase family
MTKGLRSVRAEFAAGLTRLMLPLAFALTLAACGGGGGGGGGDKPRPTVTWNPGTLNVTVVQGTTRTSQIEISVGEQINDASLVIGPEIAGVLQMSLSGNAVLVAGTTIQVATEVSVPVATLPGTYEGTVTVLSGTQAMPTALPVKIQVVPGSSSQVVNEVADPSTDRIARTASGQFMVKDEVVVVIGPEVTDPQTRIQEVAEQVGAVIIGSVPGMPIYQLRIPGADESTLESHADAIGVLPGVEAASPSLLGTGLKVPDEGLYKGLWEQGVAKGPNRHLEFIRAPEAWDTTTGATGADAVRVAVIDDDIDFGHPDLIGNLESPTAGLPYYFRTRPVGGTDANGIPIHIPGHGTAVAGTLCAKGTGTSQGVGVVGVAWNCRLRLYDALVS